MKFTIKRLWPDNLTGQMIVIILLSLVVSLIIHTLILRNAYNRALDSINQEALIRRAVIMVDLLEQSSEEMRRAILRASNSQNERVTINDHCEIEDHSRDEPNQQRLADRLVQALGHEYHDKVYVEVEQRRRQIRGDRDNDGFRERLHHQARKRRLPVAFMKISVQLSDGNWFSLVATSRTAPNVLFRQIALFTLISLLCVLIAVVFMVRRINLPVRQLAEASSRLGMGESVQPIPENGPSDIREAIHAFNVMNKRIHRFVTDRTRMLAALSHDLRTPITIMRLRIEMMEASEERRKMLETLDEMQQMTEATLSFMRISADNEASSRVNLNALLNSLCDNMQDIGNTVRFHDGPETTIQCRPVSLKRAIRNLVENGVKYGQSVDVSLTRENGSVAILIQDHGPGIPENSMARVVEPFVRLEGSRSRDTGGIGLGLSIAQNIIHNHGGEMTLQNNQHGLLVVVRCPLR